MAADDRDIRNERGELMGVKGTNDTSATDRNKFQSGGPDLAAAARANAAKKKKQQEEEAAKAAGGSAKSQADALEYRKQK